MAANGCITVHHGNFFVGSLTIAEDDVEAITCTVFFVVLKPNDVWNHSCCRVLISHILSWVFKHLIVLTLRVIAYCFCQFTITLDLNFGDLIFYETLSELLSIVFMMYCALKLFFHFSDFFLMANFLFR